MKSWKKPEFNQLKTSSVKTGNVCYAGVEGGSYVFGIQASYTCLGAYAPGPNLNQTDSIAYFTELTGLTSNEAWSANSTCDVGLFIVSASFCS